MSPPASCVAAIRLPVPGPNQHSRPLQRVQASECQPVDGFGTSSLRSPTAFHQSAQIIDYLSTMHDFDVAPLRRVETTSDRRPSLLLASQIPHQPKTASGSRVTSSLEAVCGLFSGRVNERWISIDGGITPGQPPSHRTSQISSASGATQSR